MTAFVLIPLLLAFQQTPGLRLIKTIPLPGVAGRIDHMAADATNRRLFVCALGNNTLEVVDLKAGKRIHTITGLREPQGVAYVGDSGLIVVANGQGKGCDIFDAHTYARVRDIELGEDPDNVRYDNARRLYVGYGSGELAAIDPVAGRALVRAKLPGHPESFQIEHGGQRIFVNVPSADQIAVVDREKMSVTAHWPLTSAHENFPMAFDEEHHRLFVGCRRPAAMLVYDTTNGKPVTKVDIAGDTDDLFYDSAHRILLVSCGEGEVDVIHQEDANRYRRTDRIPTSPGARTSLFIPSLNLYCVAARATANRPAEIRVYEVAK